MDKPDIDVTVTYDDDEGCWTACDHGAELSRNHRIGRGEAFAARQWLAWLTGEPVPKTDGERIALEKVAEVSGEGPDTAYALLSDMQACMPGHRTDEYEQREIGGLLVWAMACTSLDDEAALARARSCPSGTSGGWVRSDEHPTSVCPDWPTTHRHIMLRAG